MGNILTSLIVIRQRNPLRTYFPPMYQTAIKQAIEMYEDYFRREKMALIIITVQNILLRIITVLTHIVLIIDIYM